MEPYTRECVAYLVLGIATIILRLVIRYQTVGIKGSAPDDYLMIIAGLLFLVEYILAFIIKDLGGTNNMPASVRSSLTPSQINSIKKGSKVFYAGWPIYAAQLWSMKVCMILFFKRLKLGLWRDRALNWIAAIVGGSFLAIMLTILLACRPIHKNWQVIPDPGPICGTGWAYIGITGIPNLITDLMLIWIPWPVLLQLSIPLRRKIPLVILFSLGIFICIITILRHIIILRNPYNNAANIKWATRESFVSIIVGNAPMCKPLYNKLLNKFGWLDSERKGMNKTAVLKSFIFLGGTQHETIQAPKCEEKTYTTDSTLTDCKLGNDNNEQKCGEVAIEVYPIDKAENDLEDQITSLPSPPPVIYNR